MLIHSLPKPESFTTEMSIPYELSQHRLESPQLLCSLGDELSEAESIVIVADPQIQSEKRLVRILRRYGYSRSDSLGHPHPNGQSLARFTHSLG